MTITTHLQQARSTSGAGLLHLWQRVVAVATWPRRRREMEDALPAPMLIEDAGVPA